jgi:hypothetical protein
MVYMTRNSTPRSTPVRQPGPLYLGFLLAQLFEEDEFMSFLLTQLFKDESVSEVSKGGQRWWRRPRAGSAARGGGGGTPASPGSRLMGAMVAAFSVDVRVVGCGSGADEL